MKSLLLFLAYIFILALQTYAQNRSDREFDNLIGPVHNVRVERAVIKCKSGECVEGQRVRSTFDSYDIKGNLVASIRNCFDADNPEDRLHRYPFGDNPSVIKKVNVESDDTLSSLLQDHHLPLSRLLGGCWMRQIRAVMFTRNR